jgi:hypothetical protein
MTRSKAKTNLISPQARVVHEKTIKKMGEEIRSKIEIENPGEILLNATQ